MTCRPQLVISLFTSLHEIYKKYLRLFYLAKKVKTFFPFFIYLNEYMYMFSGIKVDKNSYI